MLWQIMQYDWRNLSADRTLWAVAAILAAAIGYGAYNGAAWVRFQSETLRNAATEERDRLDTVKRDIDAANAGRITPPAFLDPRSPAALGRRLGPRYAAMPPAPLAPLAIGQSDLYPYYFKVSTASKDTFLNNDEVEHPVHLLSGRFDLAFVILYLYPLLILALSYNLLSGEKEAGILALTLSQPVSLRTLVTGKLALRFLFVVALAVGLSLAGVLIGGADLSADGWLPRLALWVGVVAAYGAFWFAAAIGINALGASSATNAMALSGIWLGLVLLVPSLLNVFIKVAHPVPSRVELINSMRDASSEASAQGSKLLARYLEDHPELANEGANKGDFYVVGIAVQDEIEKKMQPVLEQFDRQLGNQQALLDRYRYLSPAIVTQSALNDLAGTSVHRYQHFLALADKFHREWRTWFTPRTIKAVKLTAADVGALPSFRFEEEPAGAVLTRVVGAFAGLVAPTLLVMGLAGAALRRYRVVG
jgi:ABC-2 type transport system permease protein